MKTYTMLMEHTSKKKERLPDPDDSNPDGINFNPKGIHKVKINNLFPQCIT